MPRLSLAVCCVVSLSVASGCSSDGSSSYSPNDGPPLYTPGSSSGGGSSAISTDDIPRSAEVVVRGTGRQSYRCTQDGELWITDRNRDRVVFQKRLFKGDEVSIDPGSDRVRVNGDTASRDALKDSHTYAFHFAPEHSSSQHHSSPPPTNFPPELSGTRRVTTGRGGLSHTFESSGTVYIYDTDSSRVVFTTQVRNGDRLTVAASKDKITVNKTDNKLRLSNDHHYELWYRKD